MPRTNTTWPTNYADADRMLHYRQDPTSREVASRKIANNSWLVRDGDAIALVLHSTAVVVWTPDGRVQLSTGGWDTPITRDRIHGCVPRGVTVGRVKGITMLTAHTGWRYDRDAHPDHPVRMWSAERLPNGRYRRCDPASCTDEYHRGTAVSDAVWRGEFRDGISFHIDDPAGTIEYGTPRRVSPPSRPRSRYPNNYYGFSALPFHGYGERPAPPRELTQSERLDALRREVAALHREADRARDPEFPYSPADAEYGTTHQVVDLVRAGGDMPPAAPVWVPRGKR